MRYSKNIQRCFLLLILGIMSAKGMNRDPLNNSNSLIFHVDEELQKVCHTIVNSYDENGKKSETPYHFKPLIQPSSNNHRTRKQTNSKKKNPVPTITNTESTLSFPKVAPSSPPSFSLLTAAMGTTSPSGPPLRASPSVSPSLPLLLPFDQTFDQIIRNESHVKTIIENNHPLLVVRYTILQELLESQTFTINSNEAQVLHPTGNYSSSSSIEVKGSWISNQLWLLYKKRNETQSTHTLPSYYRCVLNRSINKSTTCCNIDQLLEAACRINNEPQLEEITISQQSVVIEKEKASDEILEAFTTLQLPYILID
jgi:hypothetical protein